MKRPKKAAASFQDGTRLQDVGAIPQAIAAYTNCLQENPEDVEALLRLAQCHEIMERWTLAVDSYRAILGISSRKTDALLAQSECLRQAACFHQAIECLNAVITEDDNNHVAWAGKGESLRVLGYPQSALSCFDVALRIHPKNPFAIRGKAATLNDLSRFSEAVSVWDEAIELDSSSEFANQGRQAALNAAASEAAEPSSHADPVYPTEDELDQKIQLEWAKALAIDERIREADAHYQALLTTRPEWIQCLQDYLEFLYQNEEWQLAIGVSSSILSLDQVNLAALTTGGDARRAKGDYEESLELYRRALTLAPNDEHLNTSCGEALRMLEQPEAALEHYEKVLDRNSDHAFATRGKAAALDQLERYDEALELWRRALALEPENEFALRGIKACMMELNQPGQSSGSSTNRSRAHVHYDAAAALVEQGRYEAAIDACSKATKADPTWPDSWLLLGKLHDENHDYPASVAAFSEVLHLCPTSVEAACLKGDALRKQNDFRRAVASYQLALDLDAQSLTAISGMGESLRALGEYREAIEYFDKALEIGPSHFYSLCGKASCLNILERFQEAHPYWLLALAENPISPFVKRGLRECESKQLGSSAPSSSPMESQENSDVLDFEDNELQRPHLVDRQSATDELDRGRSFYREQKYAESARCFERALELDPKLAEAALRLGMAYEDDRQFRKAIASYERCLEIDPNHHQAATNIGEAYRKNERYEEAIQAYDYALSLKPDYLYALAGRSECMRMLGDYEGCLVWFDKALAQGQRHAFALQGKAAALNALHRLREAKPLWKLALSIEPQSQFALDGLSFCESQLLRESMEVGREETESAIPISKAPDVESVSTSPTIDEQGRDLTDLARNGLLAKTIGREDEIRAVIKTLMRRTKANPILLGEPGVGKTAVVEGLAQRIAAKEVPPRLRGIRLIELSLGSLVAGTKYRGTFEERLKNIVKECLENQDIVLFVDEIHTLVGAGRTEGGSLDAANILKPALARGEITVIGATTLTEYRKSFETDSALERRFQPVTIEEPSIDETIELLSKVKSTYTAHHEVEIEASAIRACVTMAIRYIPDRRLPDKALDILDEACAEASLSTKPVVTDETVAIVVSQRTGVPLTELTTDERQRLARLERLLSERVVGQHEAASRLANAIRLARTGLRSPDRPRGVFLMTGPSGVGKSDLAKACAEILFPEGNALIRLDMSEYVEKFSSSRLIGAPPGYSGHGDEGLLTGPLRRRPYAVVVLDEFEKAHPDIQSLFLGLFDEGTITDSEGRTIHGKEAFFILTTNAGESAKQSSRVGFSNSSEKDQKQAAIQKLAPYFQPELLQRLDEVITLSPLLPEHLGEIAAKHLNILKDRACEENVMLTWDANVVDLCVSNASDDKQGARAIIRAVETLVAEPLGSLLMEKRFKQKHSLRAEVKDGKVALESIKNTPQAGQEGGKKHKDSGDKEAV